MPSLYKEVWLDNTEGRDNYPLEKIQNLADIDPPSTLQNVGSISVIVGLGRLYDQVDVAEEIGSYVAYVPFKHEHSDFATDSRFC